LDGSLDVIDQDQIVRKNTSKNNSMIEEGGKSQAGGESGGGAPGHSMMNNSAMASMMKKEDETLALRKKRYKMNESNLLIMDTKSNIINILQKVLDIQNDVRLTQFLTQLHKND
jgi:hypothetical protein